MIDKEIGKNKSMGQFGSFLLYSVVRSLLKIVTRKIMLGIKTLRR